MIKAILAILTYAMILAITIGTVYLLAIKPMKAMYEEIGQKLEQLGN